VQHLIQASFRLRIKRLHKTKAFAGGALVVFIFSKAQCTLTHNKALSQNNLSNFVYPVTFYTLGDIV